MFTYLVQFRKELYYFPVMSDGKEATAIVNIDVHVLADSVEQGIANAKNVIEALQVSRTPHEKIPLKCLLIEEVHRVQ